MCGGGGQPAMPAPAAPPAPVPVRDTQIDATRSRQDASRRAAATGYQSSMLSGSGGDTTAANTASPVLGG